MAQCGPDGFGGLAIGMGCDARRKRSAPTAAAPTIEHEHAAGHEAAGLAGETDCGAADFPRVAPAAHRDGCGDLGFEFRALADPAPADFVNMATAAFAVS
jgi:hypothetical protein